MAVQSYAPPDDAETLATAARPLPARTGAALHAYAALLLARELARCERGMTPEQWAEHREWIEANARASLLAALTDRAERGQL